MFPERIQTVIDRVDRLRAQVDDHWQIPSDEALVLAQLISIGRCVSICEIGTSYGFSTLHLAAAARRHDGHVHTIDQDPKKVAAASQNLRDAGLDDVVTMHQGDARQLLVSIQPKSPFDFVFIDATKEQSDAYLDAILPKLAPRCILVTDNTTTHAEELATFVKRLRSLPGFTSCAVTVGNGFELSVRTTPS
jgi:predicted O-methyltransferase YrrM